MPRIKKYKRFYRYKGLFTVSLLFECHGDAQIARSDSLAHLLQSTVSVSSFALFPDVRNDVDVYSTEMA